MQQQDQQQTKWNWNAEDYAKHSAGQLKWAEELIAKLGLTGKEFVLDIGCGDGKVSARIAGIVPDGMVVGLDLSEDMIRLAREQFTPNENPNLAFLQCDAANIRLEGRFDVAFSNAALHWVDDHRAVLRGTRACLRRGGRLLFQMGGRGNAEAAFETISRISELPRWRNYFTGFKPPYRFMGTEEYESMLPAQGFRRERIELIPKDMAHQGAEGFAGWLRTTWFPYTDRLPQELREEFLDAVIEAYTAAYPPDEEGRIHVGMVRLEVEAVAV